MAGEPEGINAEEPKDAEMQEGNDEKPEKPSSSRTVLQAYPHPRSSWRHCLAILSSWASSHRRWLAFTVWLGVGEVAKASKSPWASSGDHSTSSPSISGARTFTKLFVGDRVRLRRPLGSPALGCRRLLVIGTGNNRVSVLEQPRYGHTVHMDGGWTVEALSEKFEGYFKTSMEAIGIMKAPYPFLDGIRPPEK